MNDLNSGSDPLGPVAESILARLRRGEQPSLIEDEYAERYPELADRIRDLFPMLVEMERLGPGGGAPPGPIVPAASLRDDHASRPLPERLGDYRILRYVGEGGMGVVYEAVRESLACHVALKVMHPRFRADADHLRRFRTEARAAAGLHHTNIVSVFDFGEHEGVFFYAMQFIRGQGLDKVLEDIRRLRDGSRPTAKDEVGADDGLGRTITRGLLTGQFDSRPPAEPDSDLAATATFVPNPDADVGFVVTPPDPPAAPAEAPAVASGSTMLAGHAEGRYYREIARVGAQVAEALAHAHKRRVYHRDIKPSNLLLDALGNAWITDFGLAKFEEGEDLSKSHEVVGTLRYMAPERFTGRSDSFCDIYALGVTLYELVTLRPAFQGRDQLRLIDQILHRPPEPPRQIDRRIPRDLEVIILKAMAKDPAHRFKSAAEMAAELKRFAEGRPIHSRYVPPWVRLWRWSRRNPAMAALTATVASLLIVLAIGSSAAAVRFKEQRDAVLKAKRETMAELAHSYLTQARAWRHSHRMGQRFAGLEAIAKAVAIARELGLPPEQFADLRDEAIACLALPDVRLARVFGSRPEDTVGMDLDGRFEIYARSDRWGNVSIRRVADDVELHRLDGFGESLETWLMLSPDGRCVAVRGSGDRAKVWRLDGQTPVLLVDEPPGSAIINTFTFSPDGRHLIYASPTGLLTLVTVATGQRRHLPPCEGSPYNLVFHPDGHQLAVACHNRGRPQVHVRPVDEARPTASLTLSTDFGGLVWDSDGRRLAFAGKDQKLYVWDVTRPKPLVLEGHRGDGVSVAFNHRGDLLASHGWEEVLRLWDWRTGQQVFSTPMHCPQYTPRFSADDRHLAAAERGSKWQLYEVAPGREYRTLVADPTRGKDFHYYTASFSPDGRLLGVGMKDGTRFWDLVHGEEMAQITSLGEALPMFTADDEVLTLSRAGLIRWPLQAAPPGGTLQMGPPEHIFSVDAWGFPACSLDGRVVVIPRLNDGALVLHRGPPSRFVRLGPQFGVHLIAVSPDGRWVAAGSWGSLGAGAFIWEAATGRLAKVLPVEDTATFQFSSNSLWLATSDHSACRLWSVGSWEALRSLESTGYSAFSPDSQLLAVAYSHEIHLYDPATGRRLAVLEDPNQDRSSNMTFSPDGTQLVACNGDSRSVHIWDLRLIRQQLAALGLDWDQPPYPPASEPGPAPVESLEIVGDDSDTIRRLLSLP